MTERPNVLVVATDQRHWDRCGRDGANPMEPAPELDRMAARRTLVRRSLTTQPVRGPARASLQTGRCAIQTGCRNNEIPLPPGERTIAHRVREVGYRTGYLGTSHPANAKEGPLPSARRGAAATMTSGRGRRSSDSSPTPTADGSTTGGTGSSGDQVTAATPGTDLALEALEGRAAEPGRSFDLSVCYPEPRHQNERERHVAPGGDTACFRDPWIPPALVGRDGDWPAEPPPTTSWSPASTRTWGECRRRRRGGSSRSGRPRRRSSRPRGGGRRRLDGAVARVYVPSRERSRFRSWPPLPGGHRAAPRSFVRSPPA